MIVKLIEVCRGDSVAAYSHMESKQNYFLNEVFINPDHVIQLKEDTDMAGKFNTGLLPGDLDPRQKFTKLYLVSGTTSIFVTVVGAVSDTAEKLNEGGQKILLKG